MRVLYKFYSDWNQKINVISRKDIDHLYVNHVLHSLAIAKIIQFRKGSNILDVGTGGGFPGIPLAILFPNANFHLVDSIGKKITVVKNIARELQLNNVKAEQARAESLKIKYDFIISRAVSAFPKFVSLVSSKTSRYQKSDLRNGIIYLKGGDFDDEIISFKKRIKIFSISDFFEEDFFETKKIIYLPIG